MSAIDWKQAEWFDKWFRERTGLSPQGNFGRRAREEFLAGELVDIRFERTPQKKKRRKKK